MAFITNARAISILDAIDTAIGTSGLVKVYDATGGVPATLDTALTSQVLLAELTLDATNAFGAATDANPGATMTANAVTNDASANATGTPAFARIQTSGATDVLQVTAAVGSGELNFTTSITSGQPVAISSFVLTMAEG